MVWLTEKKVFYHLINLGFERARVPVRVSLEFEVKKGTFVPHSLSYKKLYNKQALTKRYPKLRSSALEKSIEEWVRSQIAQYLQECGYIKDAIDPEAFVLDE